MKRWVGIYILLSLVIFVQEVERKIIQDYSKVIYPIRYEESGGGNLLVGRGQAEFFGGGARAQRFAISLAIKENIVIVSLAVFGGRQLTPSTTPTTQIPQFIYVLSDNKTEYRAKLIGEETQLGVVYYKLEKQDVKLSFLQLPQNTKNKLQIGEKVFFLDKYVVFKELNFPIKVKSYNIEMVLNNTYEEYLGFDGRAYAFGGSPVNPLALVFDEKAQLVGIYSLTQNFISQSLPTQPSDQQRQNQLLANFMVIKPIAVLKEILNQIPVEVKKGWIGFFDNSLEFITSEEAEEFLKLSASQKGLRVVSVFEGTPVFEAGLKAQDIILKIEEIDCVVKDRFAIAQIYKQISELPIGKKIKLKILRKADSGNYEEKELLVDVIEKPTFFTEAEEYEEEKLGLRVKELTIDYKYNKKIKWNQKGLVITYVFSGSPATLAGIVSGDILLSITLSGGSEKEINSLEEIKNVIEDLKKNKPQEIILKVLSGQEVKTVTLRNISW
jgi:S1-C subfamily serine protease